MKDKHETNPWFVVSMIVSALLALSMITTIVAVSKLTGTGVAAPTQAGAQQPSAGQPSAPTAQVSADDDPAIGDPNAPVTIIEFSDFQCPFCGRFHDETWPQLKANYIDTGKARLVYRDFPLNGLHPMAQKAAEAAECADEQGKFWEYHEQLFANQATLSVANFKQWAKDLGLNAAQFDSCLDSGKYADEVAKDEADGAAAGVSGTPSFFINGKLLVGAQPYSAFQQAIDAALA